MSFTRFHDDPCRINKQLQESTDPGRYMLNMPGNGDKPYYIEDPCIRIQGWGANLRTNTINLESNLKGLNQPLSRDCLQNNYLKTAVNSSPISYPPFHTFPELARLNYSNCMPGPRAIQDQKLFWDYSRCGVGQHYGQPIYLAPPCPS